MDELKVGNKVKVRSKEFFLNHPNYVKEENIVKLGAWFCTEMFRYCGKTLIVEKDLGRANIADDHCCYKMKGDNSFWWNTYMFEEPQTQLEFDF